MRSGKEVHRLSPLDPGEAVNVEIVEIVWLTSCETGACLKDPPEDASLFEILKSTATSDDRLVALRWMTERQRPCFLLASESA